MNPLTSLDRAREISATGKAIVWIAGSGYYIASNPITILKVHGNEPSGCDAALRLIYELSVVLPVFQFEHMHVFIFDSEINVHSLHRIEVIVPLKIFWKTWRFLFYLLKIQTVGKQIFVEMRFFIIFFY